jgi:hypothetical protein
VAKLISMPTSPNFMKSNFSLRRFVGSVASPYTGKVRTQEFDGVFWEASVTLPPMRRSQAVQWQSFLMQLNGPVNHFRFADPDALLKQGTYNGVSLKSQNRVSETNATLSFTASTNTIAGASNTTYFNSLLVGDHIVVSGSAKPENNGTHKVISKANAYTITVSPTDYNSLVDESNKAGCKVRDNIKGAKGINLVATTNSHNGTIAIGDYIGISESATNDASGYEPVQYILGIEGATENNLGGSALNKYSIRTEPKLRKDFTATHRAYLTPAKGKFRLKDSVVDWDADAISNYGISFNCIEVV